MKARLLAHLKERYPEISEKDLYAWIMCGEIRYGQEIFRNPSEWIETGKDIEFLHRSFVSRGGDKLAGLADEWQLDFQHKIVLDAGASTGGFTDCVLQKGALMVYAVDVGYNQLDYSLRTDERVTVMERSNIMSIDSLDPLPDIAVADLSFRSITGAAEKIISLLTEKRLYALIKPQFEIPKSESFTGIVRDPNVWEWVLLDVLRQLNEEKLGILRASFSKVKGRKGNQEFFYEIAPGNECAPLEDQTNLVTQMLKRLS